MASVTTTQMYNFLYSFFNSKTYAGVSYDPDTRVRSLGADAPIASLELNEENSDFGPSINRRSDNRDMSAWTWNVILTFNVEVDFTVLRDALMSVPYHNGARVLVQRARYSHPPRQQPNTGSKAEFVLNVLAHPQ